MRDISKIIIERPVTADDPLIGFPIVREIGELQERAARAVPGAVEENKDGCWLRYSDSASDVVGRRHAVARQCAVPAD